MRTKVEILPGTAKPDLTLEPFFRGREEARLVQLLQSPIARRALLVYFDRHGCLHCGRKDIDTQRTCCAGGATRRCVTS